MEPLLLVVALACQPGDRLIDLSGKLPRGLQCMDLIVSVEPFYTRAVPAAARWLTLHYARLRGEGSTPVPLPPPSTRAVCYRTWSTSPKIPNKLRLSR
jgi:hypothetical protein